MTPRLANSNPVIKFTARWLENVDKKNARARDIETLFVQRWRLQQIPAKKTTRFLTRWPAKRILDCSERLSMINCWNFNFHMWIAKSGIPKVLFETFRLSSYRQWKEILKQARPGSRNLETHFIRSSMRYGLSLRGQFADVSASVLSPLILPTCSQMSGNCCHLFPSPFERPPVACVCNIFVYNLLVIFSRSCPLGSAWFIFLSPKSSASSCIGDVQLSEGRSTFVCRQLFHFFLVRCREWFRFAKQLSFDTFLVPLTIHPLSFFGGSSPKGTCPVPSVFPHHVLRIIPMIPIGFLWNFGPKTWFHVVHFEQIYLFVAAIVSLLRLGWWSASKESLTPTESGSRTPVTSSPLHDGVVASALEHVIASLWVWCGNDTSRPATTLGFPCCCAYFKTG